MSTPFSKGAQLLLAVLAAMLLTAVGGAATAWAGDHSGAKWESSDHPSASYDDIKSRVDEIKAKVKARHDNRTSVDVDRDHSDKNGDHGDVGGEHGDKGSEHGDKGRDHGDKGSEHGDKGRDHGDVGGEHGDKNGDHGDKGRDHGDNKRPCKKEDKEDHGGNAGGGGNTGGGGNAGGGGQVTTPTAPAQATPVANAPSAPQGGSEGGVLGEGGESEPELAQATPESGQEAAAGGTQGTTAQQQPAELASTGFNVIPLLVIGAICIAGSILLFRRRTTA